MDANSEPEWADVDFPDEWRELGLDADEARAWDMDPMLAERWIRMCLSMSEAHAWHDAGFDHVDVDDWLGAGLSHDDAATAAELDAVATRCQAPEHPITWLTAGHTPENTLTYLRAGIRLAEAPALGPTPEIKLLAALCPTD